MLVLSRKSGESIRIGEGIVITVTEIRGGRVKIGIEAPEQCPIRRGELEDWNAEPSSDSVEQSTLSASEARVATPRPASASRQMSANERRSAIRPTNRSTSSQSRATGSSRLPLSVESPLSNYVSQ